jgi:hypothetical protein
MTYELGLDFVSSLAGRSYAPGGELVFAGGRRGGGAGFELAAQATARRELVLGPGQVSWARYGAALGGRYRLHRGRFAVDGVARVLLAAVHAQGVGFAPDRSPVDFGVGVGGGARAGIRAGRTLLLLSALVQGWPQHHRTTVGGLAARGQLPRVEALFALGVRLGGPR